MRAQLLGLEAVLADGSVVRRLPGMVKDNTGYHLPSLLAGSEGTLAVITRAHLRLIPARPRQTVALLALAQVAEAIALAEDLRRSLPELAAAELFFDGGMELVLRHATADRPFRERHPVYLLLEADGDQDPAERMAGAIADAPGVDDAVIASDEAGRARLWSLRERHTEAISAEGIAHKLDVAVPLGRLAEFIARVPALVEEARPGSATYLYGHVCDGNMHLGIIGPAPDDEAVDDAVLRLTIDMDGTVSAEHGIGAAKVAWLEADRGVADVSAMRAIKRALDPGWMLNPGVLLREGE
jgi:FAD/FMN-containing dehydrogenase